MRLHLALHQTMSFEGIFHLECGLTHTALKQPGIIMLKGYVCVKCVLGIKCCPTYFTHKVMLQIVTHKVTLQIVRLLGREAAELTLMWRFFFVVFLMVPESLLSEISM